MRNTTWPTAVAAIGASLLGLLTMAGGTASAISARSGGGPGLPQPVFRPFRIGPSSGPGSVALEPDGTLVVAYAVKSGHGKTVVCVLKRGAHACSSMTTLTPLSGDTLFGTTYAFVSSANHVEVIQEACCDTSTGGGDLLWTSTNGGKSFGAPTRFGTLGISAAALVGGYIVYMPGGNSSAQVGAVPVGVGEPPGTIATPFPGAAAGVGIGSYHSGALVAADDLGTPDTTHVAYATVGSDFDDTAAYHRVGTFKGEAVIGLSGSALLTEKTAGQHQLELRLFNGKGFGPAYTVPHTSGGGPEWFTIDQDPSGRVHVFNESTHLAHPDHLYEVSTSTGARWTRPVDLGNAIADNFFTAGLDRNGSGLVLGTNPAWGYPVLAAQSAVGQPPADPSRSPVSARPARRHRYMITRNITVVTPRETASSS